jgi:hypothetical protein
LPETYEAVLLMAMALLSEKHSRLADRREAALMSIALIFSFDTYARGGDAPLVRSVELRAPVPCQTGAARHWTLTYHPVGGKCSKMGKHDRTVTLGSSHPDRKWVGDLAEIIHARSKSHELLYELSALRWANRFHHARKMAQLAPSVPHRLRHGGASADGVLTKEDRLDDLTLSDRGDWASTRSVKRYRRPGKYVAELQKLGAARIREARDGIPFIIQSCRLALR